MTRLLENSIIGTSVLKTSSWRSSDLVLKEFFVNAQCTAPIRGHRSAAAAAACPVCGRRSQRISFPSYGYQSYSAYPSVRVSVSESSHLSSGGMSGGKRKAKWSPSGSTVLYTSAQIVSLTPIRKNIIQQERTPDKYDLFLCHARMG